MWNSRLTWSLVVCVASVMTLTTVIKADSDAIASHDGQADGKKSYGGSGPMLLIEAPADSVTATGVRIHGSRYGTPSPPDERFLIYFMDEQQERVLATELADYALFERGDEQWVEIGFERPIELSGNFWVSLDFRAHQRKGVYVSYDTSTGGDHSRSGLPGIEAEPVDTGGDWMIEVMLEE